MQAKHTPRPQPGEEASLIVFFLTYALGQNQNISALCRFILARANFPRVGQERKARVSSTLPEHLEIRIRQGQDLPGRTTGLLPVATEKKMNPPSFLSSLKEREGETV